MTGYGAADGEVGTYHVSVEIRSVNHRFFSPSIKLPTVFARWEGDVREALRRAVTRGHVTLTARVDRRSGVEGRIDETRFASYVERLQLLRQKYGLGGELDVATILRLPDVIASDDQGEEGTVAELVAIVQRAGSALDLMRRSEGEQLVAYLNERVAVLEGAIERIAQRAPARLVEQRDRLRENVRALADGVAVDEQRLAQEIALLADRVDVSEEMSRFRSHLVAFRAVLHDGGVGGDGVGKRLGFLLQEMLREANTTGSKANDAAMLQDVLLVKEELERIREQVENLE